MSRTEIQSTHSTPAFSSVVTLGSPPSTEGPRAKEFHVVLQVVYSVVLLCGTVSLCLMIHALKSSSISSTSIAILNLIFAHFIFLVTVPFRIYFYSTNHWPLGKEWCKLVSSMIHIHMFMSFILYVIILITRLLTFYNRAANLLGMVQRSCALFISVLVWLLVLVVLPLAVHFLYGKETEGNGTCFRFGDEIRGAKVFNYMVSTFVIVVAVTLTSLQANVLRVLYRKHRDGCTSQQEFGAQLKSLFFALIMVVCLVPYHIFRLHYLEHIEDLQDVNEVFLSLTTFNCLDMLTFLGRRTCSVCLP